MSYAQDLKVLASSVGTRGDEFAVISVTRGRFEIWCYAFTKPQKIHVGALKHSEASAMLRGLRYGIDREREGDLAVDNKR